MDAHGQCFSCGKDVAADAPYGLCPECLNRSVIFSSWERGTRSGVALTAAQNQTALQAGLFVGGGRFKLVRELGRGGMGVVWLAEDQRLRDGTASVRVALKFLAPEIRGNPEAMEMMQREVLHSRRLRHRNIISIYDWHSDDAGLPFISMEYVDGRTLSQIRREMPGKAFDWKQLQPILSQVCEALNYAHVVEETVHRDLKPGNIMVDAQGVVKVADFGLAHHSSVGVESAVAGRGASGTLPYMSPQQLLGRPPQPADDIYSLGVTMYELLTGTPPFFQGNLVEQILNESPQPMAQRLTLMGLPNTVPPSVIERVHQCIDKDPDRRPFPPSEVLKLFWEPEEETTPSSRGWAAPVLLLLLLLAGGWFGYHSYRERVQAKRDQDQTEERTNTIIVAPSTNLSPSVVATSVVMAPLVVETGSLRLIVSPDFRKSSFFSEIRNAASQAVARGKMRWMPPRGQSASVEELPVGEYDVTMECYSGRPADPPSVLRERVKVSPKATTSAVFDFDFVGITVQSDPSGATVSFAYNGIAIRDVTREDRPLPYSEMIPGFRTFKFSLEGYHELTTNIMVPGGLKNAFPIHVTLSRQYHPEAGKDWAFSSLEDPLMSFRWCGSFWAAVHEVTRHQFERFADETKHDATNGMIGVTADGWKFLPASSWRDPAFGQTDDHPVVAVTWDDAKAFCDWLTRRDQEKGRLPPGQRYRLPSNAEFDIMAERIGVRVGAGNFAGTEVTNGAWNVNWQTLKDDNNNAHRDSYERTAPVGKTPGGDTPRGLRDVLGNVAEWSEEWYSASMNHADVLRDIPVLKEDGGGGAYRVVRGGSWFNEQMRDLSPSLRWRFPPGERHDFVGFRLVLVNESKSVAGKQ